MQHSKNGPVSSAWGTDPEATVHMHVRCLAALSSFGEWEESPMDTEKKARSLCGSLPAQLLRHLQNKGEHTFQEGHFPPNPVIPLIERTWAGLPRSVSVSKQKFSRSPRTCRPPCAAKLWQATLASPACLCCIHSPRWKRELASSCWQERDLLFESLWGKIS